MSRAATVVIGLGNVVLCDDGLGVHAIRRLRKRYNFGGGIVIVEGGTAGLLLLPYLEDARRAILVDAIDTGRPPGSLSRFEGEDWTSACSIHTTPHDVALEDLLGAAQLRGTWPESSKRATESTSHCTDCSERRQSQDVDVWRGVRHPRSASAVARGFLAAAAACGFCARQSVTHPDVNTPRKGKPIYGPLRIRGDYRQIGQ